jgi:hypothetical protein
VCVEAKSGEEETAVAYQLPSPELSHAPAVLVLREALPQAVQAGVFAQDGHHIGVKVRRHYVEACAGRSQARQATPAKGGGLRGLAAAGTCLVGWRRQGAHTARPAGPRLCCTTRSGRWAAVASDRTDTHARARTGD